jgi:cytoskeletal protein RodZ
MEPQQERGFWSQLTTFSKVLIFLVVLGILGGSAWYIYNSDKKETVTSTPSTDTLAVSEGANTSVNTDAQASDVKEAVKEEKPKVEDVAVDEAPAKVAEPEKKAVNKKMKPIVKKITAKKTEAAPAKPKKKTKNNEDVEVDI